MAAIASASLSPTSRAPTRPGPWVAATSANHVVEGHAGAGQRVVDDGVQEVQVLAGGDLGDDAAVAVVDPLAGDDVGEDGARRP